MLKEIIHNFLTNELNTTEMMKKINKTQKLIKHTFISKQSGTGNYWKNL